MGFYPTEIATIAGILSILLFLFWSRLKWLMIYKDSFKYLKNKKKDKYNISTENGCVDDAFFSGQLHFVYQFWADFNKESYFSAPSIFCVGGIFRGLLKLWCLRWVISVKQH